MTHVVSLPGDTAVVRLPSDGAKLPLAPVTTRQLSSEEQSRYRPLTVADLEIAIREGLTEAEVASAHNRTMAQVRATLGRFGLPELSGKPRPGYSAPTPRGKPPMVVTPEAVKAVVTAHPEWRAEEYAAAFAYAPGAFADVISALGVSIKALRRAQAPPCTPEAVRREAVAHPDWTEEEMARRFALQKAEFSGKLRRMGIEAANLWPAASAPAVTADAITAPVRGGFVVAPASQTQPTPAPPDPAPTVASEDAVGRAPARVRKRTEHYALSGFWPLPALAQRLTALAALLGDDAAAVTVRINCAVHKDADE